MLYSIYHFKSGLEIFNDYYSKFLKVVIDILGLCCIKEIKIKHILNKPLKWEGNKEF